MTSSLDSFKETYQKNRLDKAKNYDNRKNRQILSQIMFKTEKNK